MLARLPKQNDPNVLVGFDRADDAGVYRLSEDLALVETVDFFTPIVDDPRTFGQIAAANSLSDIYAMGGQPRVALSIVGFPNEGRDPEILLEMAEGGLIKMQEAGCTVIGGHSIGDEEIKFGYAVTGTIHPERILTNAGAKVGDRLILTKRIGTGIISTALKQGRASGEAVEASIVSMSSLNRAASEAALAFEVHAATDITGFGLLGHAREMALASAVSLVVESGQIEFLPGAVEYSRQGFLPGGLKRNIEFVSSCVQIRSSVPEQVRNLLYDPQTSGGLLMAVASRDAQPLLARLRELNAPAQIIGEVIPKTHPLIEVR